MAHTFCCVFVPKSTLYEQQDLSALACAKDAGFTSWLACGHFFFLCQPLKLFTSESTFFSIVVLLLQFAGLLPS